MSQILPIIDSRKLRWTITLFWTVFLTILLIQPQAQPIIPTGIPPAPPTLERELYFTSFHLLFFSITGLLWCLALEAYFEFRLTIINVALFIFSYSFVTEMAQGAVPGRTPQIWDMAANVIGGLIGISIYRWLHHKQSVFHHQQTPIS